MLRRTLIVTFLFVLFAFGTRVMPNNFPTFQHRVMMADGGGGDPDLIPAPTSDHSSLMVADGGSGDPDMVPPPRAERVA